ncbi:conjugative transfer protein MobI(A/C) [Vibrio anguillarum]|uniref:conjugative transfer protein MobI(A/C) n=1 Tax=Vibrio anguillarum TaxID=55601 RepID=UPI001F428B05|nr:conjugative transfer protein MobI(A/C) [Vibrio anguillarum]
MSELNESEYFEKALSQSEMLLGEIIKITRQEPFRLEFMASSFANNFWRFNRHHRSPETPEVPGRFGCRVRVKDNKFEASWNISVFLDEEDIKHRKNKHQRVRSVHIPKGPSSRYRSSSFSKAQGWEKVQIDYCEDAFQLLREIRHEMDNIRKKVEMCQRRFIKLRDHLG